MSRNFGITRSQRLTREEFRRLYDEDVYGDIEDPTPDPLPEPGGFRRLVLINVAFWLGIGAISAAVYFS